jgi:phosphatidylserine decarboxylase
MAASTERVTTVVGTNDLHIAVVQIASRLVCRIATFASEGDELRFGQRIGAIRFGSQVDLLLPAEHSKLAVQVDDRLVAGRTIVGVVVQSAPRSHHGSVRKIKIFIRNVRVAPGGPAFPKETRSALDIEGKHVTIQGPSPGLSPAAALAPSARATWLPSRRCCSALASRPVHGRCRRARGWSSRRWGWPRLAWCAGFRQWRQQSHHRSPPVLRRSGQWCRSCCVIAA